VKRYLLIAILVLAVGTVTGFTAGCGGELPGDAVAKVGDVYISVDDFNEAVAEQARYFGITRDVQPDTYRQIEEWVVDNLVVNQLTLLEAEMSGIEVTDEDVKGRVDEYVAYYYGGDQAKLLEELSGEGVTLEDFQEDIRDGLVTEKVRDEVLKDISEVPEADITSYYQEHKADYYVEASRKVRHILVAPKADSTSPMSPDPVAIDPTTATTGADTGVPSGAEEVPSDAAWAAALATAEEVRAKLIAGADWDELAAQCSDDPTTKDSGGDLGVVYLGETIAAFEEAAFALELEDISQPVQTVYGYEIIQVLSITEAGERSLEDVRDQIQSTLLSDARAKAWYSWVQAKKAEIGVIYRKDLQPTTTVEDAITTSPVDSTTTAPAQPTNSMQP
jgi:parvulin-like peptidyl-prolyl isomerase